MFRFDLKHGAELKVVSRSSASKPPSASAIPQQVSMRRSLSRRRPASRDTNSNAELFAGLEIVGEAQRHFFEQTQYLGKAERFAGSDLKMSLRMRSVSSGDTQPSE